MYIQLYGLPKEVFSAVTSIICCPLIHERERPSPGRSTSHRAACCDASCSRVLDAKPSCKLWVFLREAPQPSFLICVPEASLITEPWQISPLLPPARAAIPGIYLLDGAGGIC